MVAASLELPSPATIAFVDREKECNTLTSALNDAKSGKGQAWLVEGAPGMGKTRLARWFEEQACKSGFKCLWAYCLAESNTPFFPFLQLFRQSRIERPDVLDRGPPKPRTELPVVTIYEDERPTRLLAETMSLGSIHPSLILSRDRPSNLRKQYPALPPAAKVLQLTKGSEGEDCLPPGQVDSIGERLSQHLKSAPGALVSLTGLDYLVSQNGFPPVLKLVQFLREEAERAGSHVLLSVNPATLEKREVALLESEGEVLKPDTGDTAPSSESPERPANTMMRYLEVLEQEAARQPCLLVLDDVQWADPDSLRTFQFLARNIRHLPVLMVGTMRSEDTSLPEAADLLLNETLERMDAEGTISKLSLEGLNDPDLRNLVEAIIGLPLAFGESSPENALLAIFQRAEGNPYFVKESMRQLAKEGLLQRVGDHAALTLPQSVDAASPQGIPIPPTLRRLVIRRLSMLSPEEMDLLKWGAVAGSEFEYTAIANAIHMPRADASSLLMKLEHEYHILESQQGDGTWSFGHPLVWEVTLAEMEPEERRKRALVLGDWWAENDPEDVERIARFYHEAIEPDRGLEWVRKATEKAISAHAPDNVERFHGWLQELMHIGGADVATRFEEGLTLSERHLLELGTSPALTHMIGFLTNLQIDTDSRSAARILLAYSQVGVDAKEARSQIELAEAEASPGPEGLPLKWDVLKSLVKVRLLIKQAKYRAAIEELRRLSPKTAEVKEAWIRGDAAFSAGFSYACIGLVTEAKRALEELRRFAEESGPSPLRVWCVALEAQIAELDGNLSLSAESNAKAVLISRARGDMRNCAIALGNAVIDTARLGEFDQAMSYLSEARKICERFGFTDVMDHTSVAECYLLSSERKWEEFDRKLSGVLSKQAGDQAGMAFIYALQTECNLESGKPEMARTSLANAEARKEELHQGERAFLLGLKSRLDESENKIESSRRVLAEAERLMEEHPNSFWGAQVKAEVARWEHMHGDRSRALTYRGEAEALFDKSGVLEAGRPKFLKGLG